MALFVRRTGSGLFSNPALKRQLASIFSCPASIAAKGRAAFVPTWRYSYAGDFPNHVLAPGVSGPYHGSEIGLIYGTTFFSRGVADTPEEIALAKGIRGAWVAFAKDPVNGLDSVWPKYNPTSESYSEKIQND
jgi:cholinesterase